MSRYSYAAKTGPEKMIRGEIDAESEQEAVSKLTQMGYFPISVKAEVASLDKQGILNFPKVSKKETIIFTSQLSSLIESGINLINALGMISRQTTNRYLRAVLSDVVARIKDGKSLSESLAAYPHLFPDIYCSMIRTGEASGKLNETLKRLSGFLEKEEELKDSILASLTYPAFVFAVGLGTILVLLVFVIPRLTTMFHDMGQALPIPTRILIGTSDFLRYYGWLILVAIFAGVFFLRRIYQSPQGKIAWDSFKLRAVFLGPVVLKSEISRLMRTLSLLLASGISITPALDILISTVDNAALKAEAQKFKDKINSGSSLSESFKASGLFPEFVNNIVSIGEETGALDKALMRIAEDYEKQVDRVLKNLTRMLEPVIILVMGLIVGFIVLSMLLPIFQINIIAR